MPQFHSRRRRPDYHERERWYATPLFIVSMASVFGAFLSLPAKTRAANPTYYFIDLGIAGASESRGNGINSSGEIAGSYVLSGNNSNRPVRWTGTTPNNLETLVSRPSAVGYGINDSGQVAGYSSLGNSDFHAVRWTGTAVTDLGALAGGQSHAYGINASGQVAGYSTYTLNGLSHAV